MKKSDILSILITFIFGLFAGAYLYLTGFASFESKITIPDVKGVSKFTIVGDVYGGCQDTCPSFQITDDGSYRYIYTPAVNAEKVLQQGKLSYELYKKLQKVLTENELVRQSRPIKPATCNSYVDGIDVVYEITLNNKVYTINSCGTSADAESELWITLGEVWTYYETI
jgi:hypothetical protein